MTAKEKFFDDIEFHGAKRVTEFGWADVPDENVWVAYRNKVVHIYSNPGGDTGYFDHYIIDVEKCHWDNMVLCAIIHLTNLDDDDHCAAEDERILLRQFAYDDTEITEEELMHAVWYLWEHDECITNSISDVGWSQHVEYEDDKEDESKLLALDDEQLVIVTNIETLFQMAEKAGVGYYQDEDNHLVFFNEKNVSYSTEYDSADAEYDISDDKYARHTSITPYWWDTHAGFMKNEE